MNRSLSCLLMIAMVATISMPVASADDVEKTCPSKKCADKPCADGEGCPIEAAMAKLPKMTYLVGTEATCCSASAAKLAEAQDASIQFVAFENTYDSKSEAMLALAEGTEKFVNSFATPHTCPTSGKIFVGDQPLTCSVKAGERAEVAANAMKGVAMTYLVGTETCSCPNKASAMAKEAGVEKQFVVAGEKTCCNIDARVRLAQAKYKAAVIALTKLDSDEAPAIETADANVDL